MRLYYVEDQCSKCPDIIWSSWWFSRNTYRMRKHFSWIGNWVRIFKLQKFVKWVNKRDKHCLAHLRNCNIFVFQYEISISQSLFRSNYWPQTLMQVYVIGTYIPVRYLVDLLILKLLRKWATLSVLNLFRDLFILCKKYTPIIAHSIRKIAKGAKNCNVRLLCSKICMYGYPSMVHLYHSLYAYS